MHLLEKQTVTTRCNEHVTIIINIMCVNSELKLRLSHMPGIASPEKAALLLHYHGTAVFRLVVHRRPLPNRACAYALRSSVRFRLLVTEY